MKYEMKVLDWLSGKTQQKISAGSFQWSIPDQHHEAYGSWFHLTTVWLHAFTFEDLPDDVWLTVEDRFHKKYELPVGSSGRR